ncbi:MAG: hypothetical protein AMXMBFR68_00020 [Ignavibacteria bacterium]
MFSAIILAIDDSATISSPSCSAGIRVPVSDTDGLATGATGRDSATGTLLDSTNGVPDVLEGADDLLPFPSGTSGT